MKTRGEARREKPDTRHPPKERGWLPEPGERPCDWQQHWWYDETGQTISVFLTEHAVPDFKPEVLVWRKEEVEAILQIPDSRFDTTFAARLLDLKRTFGGSFLGALTDLLSDSAEQPEPDASGSQRSRRRSSEGSRSSTSGSGRSASPASRSRSGPRSSSRSSTSSGSRRSPKSASQPAPPKAEPSGTATGGTDGESFDDVLG